MQTALAKTRPGRSGPSRSWLVPLVAAAALLLPAVARAQVIDNAGIFSPQAKQQAEQNIQQIKQKYKHTVLLETMSELPAAQKAAYEAAKGDKAKATQFWESLAAQRGKEANVNGVVMLICMNPKHLETVVGNQTEASGLFTQADRSAVAAGALQAMKANKPDDVATIGTASILQRMDTNDPAVRARQGNRAPAGGAAPGSSGSGASKAPPAAAPTCGGSGLLPTLLCVGVVVIGGLFLVRRFAAARAQQQYNQGYGPGGGPYGQGGPGYGPGYGQPGYGGGSGGGFGTGLMGGVLGGLGGAWLGNKVFGQGHSTPPADPGAGGGYAPPPADPYSGQDTGFSGGGGDFGGGGGDFGGGGDSGGGGGDF